MPQIVIQHLKCSPGAAPQVVWKRDLCRVEDDLETRYLRARKATFEFRLTVLDKGAVDGVLWYFPFEYDRETMPDEADAAPLSQQDAPLPLSQVPRLPFLGRIFASSAPALWPFILGRPQPLSMPFASPHLVSTLLVILQSPAPL